MNYIVETKNLKKYYQMGDATVKALDGIDFCVKDQEFIAIIGKSGSGKSTFAYVRRARYTDRRGSADRGKEHFEAEKRTVGDLSQKKNWIHFSKL